MTTAWLFCGKERSFSTETSGSDVSGFDEHVMREVEAISISSDISASSVSGAVHGTGVASVRTKLHAFIESHTVRMIIVCLIILDVIAVSLELAIASDAFGPVHEDAPCPTVAPAPPSTHGTLHPALRHGAQGDAGVQLMGVPGTANEEGETGDGEHTEEHGEVNEDLERGEKFLHWFSITILCIFLVENLIAMYAMGRHYCKFMHLFDFGVVVTSLILELLFGEDEAFVGLLVLLRLVRIVQGVVAAEQESHNHTQERLRQSLNHNKHLRRLFQSVLISTPKDAIDAKTLYLARHLLHNSKRFEHRAHSLLEELALPSTHETGSKGTRKRRRRRLHHLTQEDHQLKEEAQRVFAAADQHTADTVERHHAQKAATAGYAPLQDPDQAHSVVPMAAESGSGHGPEDGELDYDQELYTLDYYYSSGESGMGVEV